MARGGMGGKGGVATHLTDGPAAFPGKEEQRKKKASTRRRKRGAANDDQGMGGWRESIRQGRK